MDRARRAPRHPRRKECADPRQRVRTVHRRLILGSAPQRNRRPRGVLRRPDRRAGEHRCRRTALSAATAGGCRQRASPRPARALTPAAGPPGSAGAATPARPTPRTPHPRRAGLSADEARRPVPTVGRVVFSDGVAVLRHTNLCSHAGSRGGCRPPLSAPGIPIPSPVLARGISGAERYERASRACGALASGARAGCRDRGRHANRSGGQHSGHEVGPDVDAHRPSSILWPVRVASCARQARGESERILPRRGGGRPDGRWRRRGRRARRAPPHAVAPRHRTASAPSRDHRRRRRDSQVACSCTRVRWCSRRFWSSSRLPPPRPWARSPPSRCLPGLAIAANGAAATPAPGAERARAAPRPPSGRRRDCDQRATASAEHRAPAPPLRAATPRRAPSLPRSRSRARAPRRRRFPGPLCRRESAGDTASGGRSSH
jgi:hypothetical protein